MAADACCASVRAPEDSITSRTDSTALRIASVDAAAPAAALMASWKGRNLSVIIWCSCAVTSSGSRTAEPRHRRGPLAANQLPHRDGTGGHAGLGEELLHQLLPVTQRCPVMMGMRAQYRRDRTNVKVQSHHRITYHPRQVASIDPGSS